MSKSSLSKPESKPRSKPGSKIIRYVAPFAVTIAALTWVFQRIGIGAALDRVSADALLILVPALVLFGAAALWIEAECLTRLLPGEREVLTRATAARIKAASYPLALIHYAIGAAGLAVLLARRTGRGVADAGGVVALITLFDVGVQLLMMVAGVTALGTDAPAVQAGIAVAAVGAILAGFVFLRTKVSLGPLDRLRKLSIFDAARTTPIPQLFELGVLRALFAVCFVSLIAASCAAFEIDVPLTYLVASVPVLIVVAMVPSVAGLGTGQVAFLEVFGRYGSEETLLACSLTLSTGLIILRASMGLLFAREFTREALAAAREAET